MLSVLQCFFGYKIFKFWIAVQGFFIFGFIGALLGFLLFEDKDGLAFLFAIVIGIIGALISYKLYKLGVFILCFGTGLIVGIILGNLARIESGATAALAIVLGIILGIIGVILIKPIIILCTGFSGGMTLGSILAMLIKSSNALGVILGIIISVCGVVFQFYLDKKAAKTPENAGTVPPVSNNPA